VAWRRGERGPTRGGDSEGIDECEDAARPYVLIMSDPLRIGARDRLIAHRSARLTL